MLKLSIYLIVHQIIPRNLNIFLASLFKLPFKMIMKDVIRKRIYCLFMISLVGLLIVILINVNFSNLLHDIF